MYNKIVTVEVGGKGAVPTGETNPGTRTPSGPPLMPHLFSLPSLSSSSTADELSPCDRTGAQDVAGTQSHDRDTSVSCQHTCLRRKDSDGSNLDHMPSPWSARVSGPARGPPGSQAQPVVRPGLRPSLRGGIVCRKSISRTDMRWGSSVSPQISICYHLLPLLPS